MLLLVPECPCHPHLPSGLLLTPHNSTEKPIVWGGTFLSSRESVRPFTPRALCHAYGHFRRVRVLLGAGRSLTELRHRGAWLKVHRCGGRLEKAELPGQGASLAGAARAPSFTSVSVRTCASVSLSLPFLSNTSTSPSHRAPSQLLHMAHKGCRGPAMLHSSNRGGSVAPAPL